MKHPLIEHRIEPLETSMTDLKEIVAEISRQMAKNSLEIKESQIRVESDLALLSMEMKDFKNEMLEFKVEMKDFKNEMLSFKDEMKDFKDEMRDHKNESILFREEMRQEKLRHNLELGKIANKQGRMAEDLVAPSVCRIMKEALGIDDSEGCIANVRVIRPYKGDRKNTREFDVISECRDYVLINETKSSLISRDVQGLLKTISRIRDYFPEFDNRKLIGSVASLHIAPGVVNFATKNGILALAVGHELMDIQNPAGFRPTVW